MLNQVTHELLHGNDHIRLADMLSPSSTCLQYYIVQYKYRKITSFLQFEREILGTGG